MTFSFRRAYTGPLQALIFDWAGTTVDYGCFAPVSVFIEVYKLRNINITAQQARAPMGLEKKDHIRAIAKQPEVISQWRSVHSRDLTEADIEAMYTDSLPLQIAVVADYNGLIPGTLETIAACRAMGLKIGSSTGYSRPIMEALMPGVDKQGYAPDSTVCPTEVVSGRPAPWMIFQNAANLGVYPMSALVKVGDTVPDIEEGLNAGVWTIGLTKTGNKLGLPESEAAALPPETLKARLGMIEQKLRKAGAHFVVETIAEVPAVLKQIDERLQRGEQP